MTFKDLSLISPILQALEEAGYTQPTPIQLQAIPEVLQGRDLLATAQTGTGKTAAFAIPVLQLLQGQAIPEPRTIRALVLTPTRELASQVSDSFAAYGRYTGLKHLVVYGGVPYKVQTEALQAGIDILVATPGRLLDLLDQGFVDLQYVQLLVLDEADRMLDMGFLQDIRRVLQAIPEKRQTLFFSATMAPEVSKLAKKILTEPATVEVSPVSSSAVTIRQELYYVKKANKTPLLLHLLQHAGIDRTLVFMRTKEGADKLAKELSTAGIAAEAIHADRAQRDRERVLESFKNSETHVLVATDVAARGIDVEELSHVINYELPFEPETYVHRIGRTGRAGAAGVAITFCGASETPLLIAIQNLTGKAIPVVDQHPFPLTAQDFMEAAAGSKNDKRTGRGGKGKRGRR
ncbi:DEAD/DEAH box helicase [Pontibacter amylolyticus]|uniref:DEAD/DEAH box family ATP-dependent RNA helicase n=1 Tax=Pontibacter amylolyticus TaxID=1424080 RepID=A0ABQ1WB81_9BACT|nr:DEAD/DEAH box helicase [Pontibacter amylolyticus]GGG21310.1 DEAD/DEAH box family ATP-dependent RNA helicase [Pontibacter amylolyticus]